ncbi:MAG: YicC family protein [Clostridia bacterium]|nr:YicC family protein [Clostridia bacterium]
MKSMTGYGKGVAVKGDRTFTVELKAVNNRYLDIGCKLPKPLAFVEETLRNGVKAVVRRGSVDVYVNYENKSETDKRIDVDYALASELIKTSKLLRTQYCLEDDFQVTALMRSADVLKITAGEDDEAQVKALAKQAVEEAVKNLDAMRLTEGATVKADLKMLTENIIGYLEKVVKRAPIVVKEYREKLKARMKEILDGVEVDETRLLNETAFFADKADINEEISRLTSHINQFLRCLESDEPQGRKMDFLSQEMNREINTMGSKSNDTELTECVVAMKNELEKIKEQIRNAE